MTHRHRAFLFDCRSIGCMPPVFTMRRHAGLCGREHPKRFGSKLRCRLMSAFRKLHKKRLPCRSVLMRKRIGKTACDICMCTRSGIASSPDRVLICSFAVGIILWLRLCTGFAALRGCHRTFGTVPAALFCRPATARAISAAAAFSASPHGSPDCCCNGNYHCDDQYIISCAHCCSSAIFHNACLPQDAACRQFRVRCSAEFCRFIPADTASCHKVLFRAHPRFSPVLSAHECFASGAPAHVNVCFGCV